MGQYQGTGWRARLPARPELGRATLTWGLHTSAPVLSILSILEEKLEPDTNLVLGKPHESWDPSHWWGQILKSRVSRPTWMALRGTGSSLEGRRWCREEQRGMGQCYCRKCRIRPSCRTGLGFRHFFSSFLLVLIFLISVFCWNPHISPWDTLTLTGAITVLL